jgi:endonuclease/exonuclease/phosphatase family metal-dependent hydrolase
MPLRLGTFNVWGLPRAFAQDVTSRMQGLASRLRGLDLDVLLIQEAWTDPVQETLRSAALETGFEVAEGGSSSGGLMVFSRLPILSSRFETFRFRGDPERLAQGEFLGGKGLQTVRLEGKQGPLHLINTHLHACYRHSRPELNSAVRTAQLLQIIGVLNKIQGTAVIGGDFNCTRTDLEYEIFSGLTGSTELGDGKSYPTVSRSNYYKRHRIGADKRIDFLFVRAGEGEQCRTINPGTLFAEPQRIGRRNRSLSDHYGFRAAFVLDAALLGTGMNRARLFDPQIFDRARNLLRIGRDEADRREREHFVSAGNWAVAAVVAAGIRRHPAVHRRRFIKSAAGAVAAVALMPTVGYGMLARLDSDYKRDAFDDARQILVQIESSRQAGTA